MNSYLKKLEFVVESVSSLSRATYRYSDARILEKAISDMAKHYYYSELHKCEVSLVPQLMTVKSVVENEYNSVVQSLAEVTDLKSRKQLTECLESCLGILESLNTIINEENEKFKECPVDSKSGLKELCREHEGVKGIELDDLHIGVYMI